MTDSSSRSVTPRPLPSDSASNGMTSNDVNAPSRTVADWEDRLLSDSQQANSSSHVDAAHLGKETGIDKGSLCERRHSHDSHGLGRISSSPIVTGANPHDSPSLSVFLVHGTVEFILKPFFQGFIFIFVQISGNWMKNKLAAGFRGAFSGIAKIRDAFSRARAI